MKKFSCHSRIVFALSLVIMAASGQAAVTDISPIPLATGTENVVKPNVMFILDDSGSMAWDYLPDVANFSTGKYGKKASQCNGMYYNPAITYQPPVNADGTSFPNANFGAALPDGFKAAAGQSAVNLRNSVYYTYSGTQPPLSYTYSANGNVITGTTFYTECNSSEGTKPSIFTKHTVTSTSPESTNFANWYTYYRTRVLAMKTSAGLAFKTINDNYRVGYTTPSYPGTDSNNNSFLKIDDFTFLSTGAGQKNTWYDKLYKAGASGGTPLRAALSKVGRMYAGKLLTGKNDPVQYSCQQNFAILATDGYWNGDDGYQMDGTTAVGNQDGGNTLRPMLDANGSKDSLADVAMYYYKTDLRASGAKGAITGVDVGKDNVRGDDNKQQHMTTFTLGLGLQGTLNSDNYLSGGSADYNAIVAGTKNWPVPSADDPTTIDDLWHAAVNGHGTYFSAKDPTTLVAGLTKALAGIDVKDAAGAGGTASNLSPVVGDNLLFTGSYRTGVWDGDLQALTIDPNTLAVSTTPLWKAQTALDKKVSAKEDTREIYVFDSTAVGNLKSFTWDALNDTEETYFKDACAKNLLSQCTDLTDAQKNIVNAGETLVGFLRGRNGNEDQSGIDDADRLYRDREHVLGDIVGSQPAYVKQPPFNYIDDNYSLFKAKKATRDGMVYVGANDGMLHAFDSATGIEKWAYIPPMVLPNLYKLADKHYATKHQFFVDGSPVIGDICPKAPATCAENEWKTILVGGLNAGGKGYYALDITNPIAPKALWNFIIAKDGEKDNMGLSFGNPIITKRRNGMWVVALTSGYNNIDGDGKGHLYLLKASTGDVQLELKTTAGDIDTPSGLAKIAGWVDSVSDNTSERYYGGDLLGNVWRFDTEDVVLPAGREALLLAELGNVSPVGVQPITTKPLLSEIVTGNASYAIVTVGTGRYLGESDRTNVDQQSIYALKDDLSSRGLGKVRASSDIVEQVLINNADGKSRTTSGNAVNWNTKSGWYMDLNPGNTSPGERINVDMRQLDNNLFFAGNVPDNNACSAGGSSWLYTVDYRSGQYVQNSANNNAGQYDPDAMSAGITPVSNENGDKRYDWKNDGSHDVEDIPSLPPVVPSVRRVSWQELIVD